MSQLGVARGPYRNGVERRQQLIVKAAEIFATYGYRGGSLRQIALAVGVTPAAVSRHFDSKEDLLTGVLEYWRAETDSLMDQDAPGLAFFNELRKLVRYHVKHRGYLELFLSLATEASDPYHPAAEFMRARYRGIISSFSTKLMEAVDNQSATTMSATAVTSEIRELVAYMDGIEVQWLLDPSIDLVGEFNRYLDRKLAEWTAN